MAIDLNDSEVKAAIKAAADAAVSEATAGLLAKNQELLGKVKKLQKDAAIDPAEYQALSEAKDTAEAKLAEALKTVKQATTQAEKDRKALEAETGYVSKLLIDNGLTESLLRIGVKPELSKAARARIREFGPQIKVDGDKRLAVVGDKALGDFVAEWGLSDEGKNFVAAPANQGGGANGGAPGAGKTKVMARAAFDSLAPDAKMEFTKGGGKLTD
jgi:hypothetical protein